MSRRPLSGCPASSSVALPVTLAAACALGFVDTTEGYHLGWFSWHVYSVVVIFAVVRFLRAHPAVASHALRPTHALLLVIPLLVALNGLTPYAEIKTGYGFNMYANLRTVDGDSNHFLVRSTLPLTDQQAELVRVVSTDDRDLQRYADSRYALTWGQLRAFMVGRPGVALTYERAGERVVLARAEDDPELVRPVAGWEEKVQFFRPVDLTSPERCQPTFGAAR